MLSKHSLWVIDKVMTAGKYFHAGPFDWDRHELVVSVRKRTWIWKCIVMILFAYSIFAWVRLIQSMFWHGRPLYRCITQIYFAISSFYFGVLQLACLLHYEELAMFWTRFLQFDRKYSHPKFNGDVKEWFGPLCKLMVCMTYSHMITQAAGFFVIRKSPNFVYSLIWETWGIDTIPVRLLFAFFEMVIMFYSWQGAMVVNAGIIMFPNSVKIWNGYVCKHGRAAWRQQKGLYYRSLQVLARNFEAAYSSVALPGQESAVLFGGIICFYATIKFYGIVHILVYMTMPISLLILLCFEELFHWGASSVYTSTQKLLQNFELEMMADVMQPAVIWKNATYDATHKQPFSEHKVKAGRDQEQYHNFDIDSFNRLHKLEQRRCFNSFHPIGIYISSMYIIQAGTIMTFGSLILNNAITLLLAD